MPVTNYTSINGRVIGETVNGVPKVYMTDALGSVTGYRDGSGNIVNQYWYKPYGGVLAKQGAGADPSFMFGGYLNLNRSFAGHSARRRNYDDETGMWTTVDPLWPGEPPFGYAGSNPLTNFDPDGDYPYCPAGKPPKRRPPTPPWDSPDCKAAGAAALAALSGCFNKSDAATLALVMQCIAYGESNCSKIDNSDPVFGLYQLDCTQYNACAPKGCPPCGKKGPDDSCGIFQHGCNTTAAVSYIAWLFDTFSGDSLGDVILPGFRRVSLPASKS
jgi:RHS repeat-associated protein